MYDTSWGAPAPAMNADYARVKQIDQMLGGRVIGLRIGPSKKKKLKLERARLVARLRAGKAQAAQAGVGGQAKNQAKNQAKKRAKRRAKKAAEARARAIARGDTATSSMEAQVSKAHKKARNKAIKEARKKARRQRARARLRAQAQASGGAVTVPAGAAAGVRGRAPRRVRKWTIQTLPVAKSLRRRGMSAAIAAQQAATSVGVPSNVRAAVVSKVRGILLRTGRRRAIPPRRRGLRAFIPSAWTTTTATPTASSVITPLPVPVGPRPPGAIPNWMFRSGGFSPYQVSSMMSPAAPAAPADDDLDLDDEDFLEEEIPFYKRPLVLVGAAVVGYFAYQKYGKKGKRRPKAGKQS